MSIILHRREKDLWSSEVSFVTIIFDWFDTRFGRQSQVPQGLREGGGRRVGGRRPQAGRAGGRRRPGPNQLNIFSSGKAAVLQRRWLWLKCCVCVCVCNGSCSDRLLSLSSSNKDSPRESQQRFVLCVESKLRNTQRPGSTSCCLPLSLSLYLSPSLSLSLSLSLSVSSLARSPSPLSCSLSHSFLLAPHNNKQGWLKRNKEGGRGGRGTNIPITHVCTAPKLTTFSQLRVHHIRET